MSKVMEKTRGRATGAGLGLPPRPQVNLLPPEVAAARGLTQLKRWLLLGLAGVLLVLALVYAFAVLSGVQARAELAQAQDETARLMAEEATYAEVPAVLGRIDETKRAREFGMSTEVRWKSYYDAFAAVLPEGVSIDSLRFNGATPTTLAPAAGSPLERPSVGEIQFTGRSLTVPDSAAWADSLDSIPGFSDTRISALTITADEAGTPYYTVSATVRVTADAYTHRFASAPAVTTEEG